MRYTYNYTNYRDCPEATAYSEERNRATFPLSIIPMLWSLVAVGCFIVTTINFIKNPSGEGTVFGLNTTLDWIISIIQLLVVGGLLLYVFFLRTYQTDKKCEIMVAKRRYKGMNQQVISRQIQMIKFQSNDAMLYITRLWFGYLLAGMAGAIVVIGIIIGANSTIKGGSPWLLIGFASPLLIAGSICGVWVLRKRARKNAMQKGRKQEIRKKAPLDMPNADDEYNRVLQQAPTMSDSTVNNQLDEAIQKLAQAKTPQEVALLQARMKALREIQTTRK